MKTIFKRITVLASLFCCWHAQANYALPPYQKLQLDNGLTIYLLEQHEVPLIDVNVVVKVGAVNDGEQSGINALTVANLSLGTEQQSKAEIEESLDFIGANIDTYNGAELSTLSASFASKDQAKVLGILRDIMISPRFDPAEFAKHKTRHLTGLEQQKESPRSVIKNYYNQMIFGEHGYGAPVDGNTNSVKAITLEQIKGFYSTWYRPQNSAVVIAGDFDSKTMLVRLKALFSGWEKGKKLPTVIAGVAKHFDRAQVLLVDKPDAIETRFLIGGQGIKRDNPDFVSVAVINTILGGRFTSWLNDALRVSAGLTYGARSSFDSFSQSGTFAISTFTKTSTTIEAIDLALKTYERLWQDGIDEATLASAKAYVKGQFPPDYETTPKLANLLAEMFVYGFDEKFINQFEQQVNALTPAKAKQIINQYFPKDNLQFVLIGNAAAIKEQVVKYGNVKQVNIKDVGFKAM